MEKVYVDRETQTEFSNPPQSRKKPSIPHQTAQDDGAVYRYRSPTSLPATASSICLSRRAYKGAQSTYNRPSNRVVSFPETEPLSSIENVLLSPATRVASMSERPKPDMSVQDASSLDSFELSASTENSFPTQQDTLSYRPKMSDVPHTPSPPSSPESVMIIDNSIHLPQSFLRHDAALDTHSSYDDDGWITWASSPPRPIPALHGPLSLPYARCPSGAEGTIIEGPDDLPRMIWGLGPDDIQPPHSHDDILSTSRKPASNPQSTLASRLHKMQTPASQARVRQSQRPVRDVLIRPAPLVNEQDHNQAIPRQGAISDARQAGDTYTCGYVHENILQPNIAKASHTWSPVCGLSDNRTMESFGQDLRAFDMERGLGLTWQATLPQDGLESCCRLGSNQNLAKYLKASAPTFVPASQVPLCSLPRIFVEPRPAEVPISRLSAIEMSQKHRQQRNSLPTPPSSSSSQWSPYLTPYQDSPDLALLSPAVSIKHAQQQYCARDSLQQHDRLFYESLDRMAPTKKPSFAAPTQINSTVCHRLASHHFPDPSGNLIKLLQHRHEISSPPHPGPPPNTPLPPVPIRGFQYDSSPSIISSSPTSLAPKARTLSHHQPRSVPLARLMERRLSSVPEEEMTSFIEQISSPPPSPCKPHVDAPPFQHVDIRSQRRTTTGPDVVALAPQTEESGVAESGKITSARAKVKFPNVNLKTSGTVTNRLSRSATGRIKDVQAVNMKSDHSKGKNDSDAARAVEGTKTTLNSRKKLRGKKIKTSQPAERL